MSDKVKTVTLRGKTQYAKILGDPILNYQKDGKEWKMDFVLTGSDTVNELKKLGIADRIKSKPEYLDGAAYLTFKQREFKKDGSPNKPIRVVDKSGQPWGDKLIGNGSDVDVQFVVIDYGPGMKKGVYIRGVRVLKLVEYDKPLFDDLDENDEFYEADDLDDPVDDL